LCYITNNAAQWSPALRIGAQARFIQALLVEGAHEQKYLVVEAVGVLSALFRRREG